MSDFWARRKASVQAEEREIEAQAEVEVQADREAALAERTDEDILAELDLPDPDTLEQGDDFKVFLSEAVPARIRTRALRRLWRLNPVLANIDGLVDYGEDFTDAACVVENLQTAYQVGKGMTQHVLEMARKAELAEAEMLPDSDAQDGEGAPLAAAGDETVLAADEAEKPAVSAAEPHVFEDDADTDDAYPNPSRRMRFAFDVPLSGSVT